MTTEQHAAADIGPPHEILDFGARTQRISVPTRLIGSPGQALQVWCCIKSYTDRGHDIPTNEALARRCNVSRSAVGRALVWLRREGWLA